MNPVTMRSTIKTIRSRTTCASIIDTASDMMLETFVFVPNLCEFRTMLTIGMLVGF